MRMILVVVVATAVGCGTEGPSTASPAEPDAGASGRIGRACNDDGDCSTIPGGYCPPIGVCSRPCKLHSDCGCAANTLTADISAGKCGFACMNFGGGTEVCVPICSSPSQCQGASICQANYNADGRTVMFSYCGPR